MLKTRRGQVYLTPYYQKEIPARLFLDGISSYMYVAPLSFLFHVERVSDFTVALEIEPVNHAPKQYDVCGAWDERTKTGFRLYFEKGRLVWQVNRVSIGLSYDGKRVSIACGLKNSRLFLSVGGVRTESDGAVLYAHDELFRVGSCSDRPASFFPGFVSEVSLWSLALTESQIRTIFSNPLYAKNIVVGDQLIGYWKISGHDNCKIVMGINDHADNRVVIRATCIGGAVDGFKHFYGLADADAGLPNRVTDRVALDLGKKIVRLNPGDKSKYSVREITYEYALKLANSPYHHFRKPRNTWERIISFLV